MVIIPFSCRWRFISQTRFVRALAFPCLLYSHSPGLASTAAALVHGETVLWLKGVDGLFQPSHQAVSNALERDMRLFCRFNDIAVIWPVVFMNLRPFGPTFLCKWRLSE